MRVRLGTPFLRVWFNSRMRPCQGRDDGAIPFTRSIYIGSVAHQQSARLTCERQRGQHSPLPPFFRGHSSVSRAGASHAPGRRRDSFCPHHLSLWCSPDNMPASHAGDHRIPQWRDGQGRQFSCPQSILSDALLWYGNQLGAIPGGGSSFWASG